MSKRSVLLINTRPAICSIHQFGKMVHRSLSSSPNWKIDYIETQQLNLDAFYNNKIVVDNKEIDPYDVYIFNYHDVMRFNEGVHSERFSDSGGIKIAIIMEMKENNPLARNFYSTNKFDGYMVIDPTMVWPDPRYHMFPRPLIDMQVPPYIDYGFPIIGSFGLGFDESKGFEKIIEAVNAEFDRALIRFNLPPYTYGTFDAGEFEKFKTNCRNIANPNIQIEITQHLFTEEGLIRWCGENTLNAFFYNRPNCTGLSSAVDHALISDRPVAVNGDRAPFRHIHAYQPFYPKWSLKEHIELGVDSARLMKKEWSIESFQNKFEQMLHYYNL